MYTSGCTILVSSCDKYEDLWVPFFELYRRFWSDCDYPILLITEVKSPKIHNVKPLRLGAGKDWSSLLLAALEQVQTETVLLTLEDFFLKKQVDSSQIAWMCRFFTENSLNMLRLVPRPGPDLKSTLTTELGVISNTAAYRVSTQASIWSVTTLKSLLVIGESAWEFERNGTMRSQPLKGFMSVYKPVLPYGHHVVERGKWFPWSAKKYSDMYIGVDLSARDEMSFFDSVYWLIRKILSLLKQVLQDLVSRVS